jgi:hypothetical protein
MQRYEILMNFVDFWDNLYGFVTSGTPSSMKPHASSDACMWCISALENHEIVEFT